MNYSIRKYAYKCFNWKQLYVSYDVYADVGGDEVKGEKAECEKNYIINPLCLDNVCDKYCYEKHPSNHTIGICIDHLTCQCKFTCH